MGKRKILIYPEHENALRRVCEPIRTPDQNARALIKDLKDTLAAHPEGIGLSAPQINVHKRVVIIRLGVQELPVEPRDPPLALINPLICRAGQRCRDYDGCLSFPGLYGITERPHYLRVSWLDESGQSHITDFRNFDAVLVHHEIDHLDGVLFIDRIQRTDDLFRIIEDEFGHPIRVPALADFSPEHFAQTCQLLARLPD
jgi:peptide deformylase